jgi:hypothetical protein
MDQKEAYARRKWGYRTDRSKACEYCGYTRCAKCKPDRWLNLADGCCECQRRVLYRLLVGKTEQCKEMPQLYGPGLAVSQTCRFPFWGITLKGSL